jgi:hypothetical protein
VSDGIVYLIVAIKHPERRGEDATNNSRLSEQAYEHPGGEADVAKSLSAKIPYSSPDHPVPCPSMPEARQATGAEHLAMSHHRIGKALTHICLPGGKVSISKTLRHCVPSLHATKRYTKP